PPCPAPAGRQGNRGACDLGRQLLHVARNGRRLRHARPSRRGADRAARPSVRLRDVPRSLRRRPGIGADMTDITTARLVAVFTAVSQAIDASRDDLSRLDGVIGDADHGVTMSMGFAAVNKVLAALDPAATPTTVFNTAAKAFLNAVGASSGPL